MVHVPPLDGVGPGALGFKYVFSLPLELQPSPRTACARRQSSSAVGHQHAVLPLFNVTILDLQLYP